MKTSMDPIWDKIHSSKEWGQYPAEHIIRFVARNYYNCNRKNVKILDFGMGGGAHTWYLAREGFDTYAFDGSEFAVQRTQNKLDRENLCANVRKLDGLYLDYPDNYFDAVIDNVSIDANKLIDITSMYKAIYKILKPSGKLCTVCFDKNTTGYGTGEQVEKDTFTNMTEGIFKTSGLHHFFDKESISHLLTDVGFKEIKHESLAYTDAGNTISEIITTCVKK